VPETGAEAARHGRTVRFSLSVRPIVGRTEEAAWQRAEQIRAATEERVGASQGRGSQVQGIQVPDTPGPARRLFGFRESSSVGSERLQQQAAGHDLDGSFPAGGISQVHGAGLLTATVARRHGGAGAGLATTVSILRALGHGDPSVALITAMTLFTHAMQARGPAWPLRIYEEVLEESAGHPVLINALRVEPELGTPARGGLPATVARWHSGTWLLSGRKTFSTGAEGLRWMVVWARTDEDPARVGSFLVRADSAGISIERTWDHLGLRASRSDDVIFTDTPVPPAATAGLHDPDLPGPPSPAPADDGFLAWNSLGLAAIYLGVAAAARDWLASFLGERTPRALGRPLATLPRFQAAVGEIETALAGADDLVDALTRRVDAGDETVAGRPAMAKLIATRAAIGAVEQAVALVGNNALTRKNPLERHYRDVLCARVHTPQDDTILAAAGHAALAADRRNPTTTTGAR
jgi:alkylation response protein AidB-like acyl-CoA dehydrogenase